MMSAADFEQLGVALSVKRRDFEWLSRLWASHGVPENTDFGPISDEEPFYSSTEAPLNHNPVEAGGENQAPYDTREVSLSPQTDQGPNGTKGVPLTPLSSGKGGPLSISEAGTPRSPESDSLHPETQDGNKSSAAAHSSPVHDGAPKLPDSDEASAGPPAMAPNSSPIAPTMPSSSSPHDSCGDSPMATPVTGRNTSTKESRTKSSRSKGQHRKGASSSPPSLASLMNQAAPQPLELSESPSKAQGTGLKANTTPPSLTSVLNMAPPSPMEPVSSGSKPSLTTVLGLAPPIDCTETPLTPSISSSKPSLATVMRMAPPTGDGVDQDEKAWTCLACTFENGHAEASCAACTCPRSGTAPLCSSCHKAAANMPFDSCCRPCALGVPGCACAPLTRPLVAATAKAAAKSPAALRTTAHSRPPTNDSPTADKSPEPPLERPENKPSPEETNSKVEEADPASYAPLSLSQLHLIYAQMPAQSGVPEGQDETPREEKDATGKEADPASFAPSSLGFNGAFSSASTLPVAASPTSPPLSTSGSPPTESAAASSAPDVLPPVGATSAGGFVFKPPALAATAPPLSAAAPAALAAPPPAPAATAHFPATPPSKPSDKPAGGFHIKPASPASAPAAPFPPDPAPEVGWACPTCTFENGAGSSACDMCGTHQPGATLPSFGESGWPGGASTSESEQNEEYEERHFSFEEDAPIEDWVCRDCTFENGGLNRSCEMCESPRPSQAPPEVNKLDEKTSEFKSEELGDPGTASYKAPPRDEGEGMLGGGAASETQTPTEEGDAAPSASECLGPKVPRAMGEMEPPISPKPPNEEQPVPEVASAEDPAAPAASSVGSAERGAAPWGGMPPLPPQPPPPLGPSPAVVSGGTAPPPPSTPGPEHGGPAAATLASLEPVAPAPAPPKSLKKSGSSSPPSLASVSAPRQSKEAPQSAFLYFRSL